uniref:Uncharacterized protein n=1 Tax=Dicentrarchus labrax TaxID=13489 RepID=A0A8P4JZT5_DICLA
MVFQVSSCLKGYLAKVEYRCQCWRPKSPKRSECPDDILESEEEESTESIKSAISVHSVTKAVTNILVSWSSENPEIAHTPSFLTILDAEAAAPEIVRNALETLHYPDIEDCARNSEESLVPIPHFNMRSIVGKVRDFYTSQASINKDTTDNSQTARRLSFLKFAKNQYKKMMAQLMKASDKEHPDFLVSLRQDSGSSQQRLTEEDDASEDFLEQTVPESPTPESEAGSQSNMGSTAEIKKLSSVDFETIKIDLDSLFQQLISPDKPAVLGTKTLENTMSSEHIRKFAKELTDKLCDHLMSIQTFQRSAAPMTRSLSYSDISELRREVDATTQFPFSPDVMYAMTEDAVRKFLQQVLLWVNMEPSNKSSRGNAVHGALKDIEELITKTLTTPEDENVIEPEDENIEPEDENVIELEDENIELDGENAVEPEDENIELEDENVIEPEDENVIEPEDENIESEDENAIEPEDENIEPEGENVIEPEDENAIEPEDENIEPEDENVIEPEDENIESEDENAIEPEDENIEPEDENIEPEDENAIEPEDENAIESEDENIEPDDENVIEPEDENTIEPEDENSGPSVVSTNTSTTRTHTAQRITTQIITALVMRMIIKAPQKTMKGLQIEDIDALIKRLTDKAQVQIVITDSAVRKIKHSMKKVNKAVMEDLKEEFGSQELLLEAAMGSDPVSFDEAFVKQLKSQLNVLLSTNKKAAVVRFFRAVGNALTKPFRCCIVGCSTE